MHCGEAIIKCDNLGCWKGSWITLKYSALTTDKMVAKHFLKQGGLGVENTLFMLSLICILDIKGVA